MNISAPQNTVILQFCRYYDVNVEVLYLLGYSIALRRLLYFTH